MKYWKVTTAIRDGEHEYGEYHIAAAETRESLIHEIHQYILFEYWGEFGAKEIDELHYEEAQGYRIFQIEHIEEIPEADYQILKKYLPTIE